MLEIDNTKIFYLTALIIFIIFPIVEGDYNCKDAPGVEFDIEKISGEWYEVARLPQADVPACVCVTAPNELENGNYILNLRYANNVKNPWQSTNENLTFPWNNATKSGLFVLSYKVSENSNLDITFKLVATDYESFGIVCGYADSFSGFLVKIMARQRIVNDTIVNMVNKLAEKYEASSDLTWVEQGMARCEATNVFPTITVTVSVLFGAWRILKWNLF